MKGKAKRCEFCGETFIPVNQKQKYCTQKCNHDSYLDKLRKKTETNAKQSVCPVCSKEFKAKGSKIFCSEECRKKSYKQGFAPQLGFNRSTKKMDNLTRQNEEARKLGITYGQYKAMQLVATAKIDIGGLNGGRS